MILAAPLVIPFAEAIGVSIAALGMAKATDKVNEFIQENPEQSIKIFQMIMPSQGIANALKNKSSEGDEEVSEDIDVEVEEKPKLTGKEKSERIKAAIRRARAGKGNYSSPDAEGPAVDIGGSVIREVEDMGIADKDLKDNYDPTKPKFDYKKFFKKRYADGGSIGIEVLFGPKVPAAPSQLVSESDILLGYRGDAGYRSGSEQSKSIGQGNVGSKASFGGGQGTDRSGRSEGAGGVNPNQYTSKQQNINQIKAQPGIKDPNLLQKTFNKYNSLPFYAKGAINTMAPVELMKLFQVGNALNTGYNQIKNPVLTDEDITLEPGKLPELTLGMTDNPLPSENLLAFEPGSKKDNKLKSLFKEKGLTEDLGIPFSPKKDKQLQELMKEDQEQTDFPKTQLLKAADGGRVGLFMGGSPLTGQALAIYNSMNAYGFDDQAIANALTEQGLYTAPGDSTPDTPDTTPGNTMGLQTGSDNFSVYNPDPNSIKPFKPMGANFQNQKPNAFSTGIAKMMDNPVMKTLGFAMNPPLAFAKGILSKAGSMMPVNERSIFENLAGNQGVRVDDIGRIVNTGKYNTPEGVMAGYNLNQVTDKTFDKRTDRIEKTLSEKYGLTAEEIEDVKAGTYTGKKGFNTTMGTTTNLFSQLRNILSAKNTILGQQNIAAQMAKQQREAKAAADALAIQQSGLTDLGNIQKIQQYTGQPLSDYRMSRPESERNYTGGSTNSNPSTPGAQDGFSNKSGMGRTGYSDGGLVTMFKEKR
jgi:hypothetical protein